MNFKATANTFLADKTDSPAKRFDNPFDRGQPDAHTFNRASFTPQSIKWLEDSTVHRLRDSHPGIPDAETKLISPLFTGNIDLAIVLVELDGVR